MIMFNGLQQFALYIVRHNSWQDILEIFTNKKQHYFMVKKINKITHFKIIKYKLHTNK